MEKKVLIVEDDKMISAMYETKLKQEKYNVIIAENGSQGLDLAVKEKPDLVLLDVILPQMDGFSVLRELRLNSNTKKIPIIMLTNLGTSEDQEKGKKMGATDYWIKAQMTPAQVSDKVKELLK
ncbi:response regulator [Candidatus Parcubacteria bacterium]|nr:response regulator [Candidatus Parcubacteria bacterium]